MEDKILQSGQQNTVAVPTASVPPSTTLPPGFANGIQAAGRPHPQLDDDAVQSLLTINNLQAGQRPKAKLPRNLLLAIMALIALVIAASYLLGAFKPGASTKPGRVGLPDQPAARSGKDINNQINQDVKACSNPVNATLVC